MIIRIRLDIEIRSLSVLLSDRAKDGGSEGRERKETSGEGSGEGEGEGGRMRD